MDKFLRIYFSKEFVKTYWFQSFTENLKKKKKEKKIRSGENFMTSKLYVQFPEIREIPRLQPVNIGINSRQPFIV